MTYNRTLVEINKTLLEKANSLFKEKNWPVLYEFISSSLAKIDPSTLSEDNVEVLLWLFYYAASAPLETIELNADEEDYRKIDSKDLTTKEAFVLTFNNISYFIGQKKKTLPKLEKYKQLTSQYLSATIATYKKFHDPNLDACIEKKAKELELQVLQSIQKKRVATTARILNAAPREAIEELALLDNLREQFIKLRNQKDNPEYEKARKAYVTRAHDISEETVQLSKQINASEHELAKEFNHKRSIISSQLGHMKNRNLTAEVDIPQLEKYFIAALVNFYPGEGKEVKKYIKMAGYTDDEIPDLIDRTAGRVPKTEFLYKNRKGSQKNMRKKE